MMTSISNNSAALTILTQTSPIADSSKSAADNILSIVSGSSTSESDKAEEARLAKLAAQKAKIAALDQPREAGGSVSSEISSAWNSAMNQIARGIMLTGVPDEPGTTSNVTAAAVSTASTSDPWDAAVADATKKTLTAVGLAITINGKFHLEPRFDVETQISDIEAQRQQKISAGEAEETANAWAQQRIRHANAYDTAMGMLNNERTNRANGTEAIASEVLAQVGLSDVISVAEDGKAKVKSFDITGADGKKLLSLGEDGSLTTFNADGSVRSQMTRRDVSFNAHAGGSDHVRPLEARGADLNQLELY